MTREKGIQGYVTAKRVIARDGIARKERRSG